MRTTDFSKSTKKVYCSECAHLENEEVIVIGECRKNKQYVCRESDHGMADNWFWRYKDYANPRIRNQHNDCAVFKLNDAAPFTEEDFETPF